MSATRPLVGRLRRSLADVDAVVDRAEAMAGHLRTELVLEALEMAHRCRAPRQ